MRETRIPKKIKNKVFSKKDIFNIWKIFSDESVYSKENNNNFTLEMQIVCSDGTLYKSDNKDLLSEGDIIDLKKIKSISFRYVDYKKGENKNIDVELTQGIEYNNELTISGNNNNWVMGTFSKFENILNAVKPQEHWFISYKKLIIFLVTLVFGFRYLWFIG